MNARNWVYVFLDRDWQLDRESYLKQMPFPYLLVDDVLPRELGLALLKDFPNADEGEWSRRGKIFNVKGQAHKYEISDQEEMPASAKTVIAGIHDQRFVDYIEAVTGLPDLYVDQELFGGGLNCVPSGGFLENHVDFNLNRELGGYRAINIILYLNPDWRREYGGCLELSAKVPGSEAAHIVPVFNRMVMFATNNQTVHGFDEVCHPQNVSRRSMNFYFYSENPPPDVSVAPHRTIWESS